METIEVDKLIKELSGLNFKDNSAVMDWMCKILPLSQEGELIVKKFKILEVFLQNDFAPDVNIGISKDLEIEAKAIIQWGLHSMDTCLGQIHPMFNILVRDWKNKKFKEMLDIFSFSKPSTGEKREYYNEDEILEILNSDIYVEHYECSATTFEEAEVEFLTVIGNMKYGNDEKLRKIIEKWLELSTDCFKAKKVFAYAFDAFTKQMVLRKVASFYGWTRQI